MDNKEMKFEAAVDSYQDRDPIEVCKEMGLKYVVSTEFHLQLDIDSRYDYWKKNLEQVERDLPELVIDYLETKSKRGFQHVYIRVSKSLTYGERIALQLILGSDPVRERLALRRVLLDLFEHPIVLFETPNEFPKVKEYLGLTYD